MKNPRIALYSPGMVGLGHMRRNLLLVRRFASQYPAGSFLLITEAREAGIFDFPDNTDCVSLPAIRKDFTGKCSPRRLGIELKELVRLRQDVITAAIQRFSPDVFIADHLPCGALGEILPALEILRAKGARLVLGLRDVLEEPETVAIEWERAGNYAAIDRFYDEIWIYGDPSVFNPLREYRMPAAISYKTHFTGYLDPTQSTPDDHAGDADTLAVKILGDKPFVLCQVGGGQDGQRIAEAFLDAEMPRGNAGVLLTGPFMSAEARHHLARRAASSEQEFHVLDLISEPAALLSRASRVVTMGGYNSVIEVLAHGKRALVIPRTSPRKEQLIRARRLSELGVVEWLDPMSLSGAAISDWLARDAGAREHEAHIDMAGLDRATDLLARLIARSIVSRHLTPTVNPQIYVDIPA